VTRDYWRSQDATLGEFAARLTGSSDLYQDAGRTPSASINFVTAHEGFTLRDLVCYNEKHNVANGENNQDSESHNRSWNLGSEGAPEDEAINAARRRQQRNFLATLMVSQGVPMLLGETKSAARNRGTTTRIARTTRSPGSTGNQQSRPCWTSRAGSSISLTGIPCFAAGAGARGGFTMPAA
jgi:pullulanase/glycogen debranching enzyme